MTTDNYHIAKAMVSEIIPVVLREGRFKRQYLISNGQRMGQRRRLHWAGPMGINLIMNAEIVPDHESRITLSRSKQWSLRIDMIANQKIFPHITVVDFALPSGRILVHDYRLPHTLPFAPAMSATLLNDRDKHHGSWSQCKVDKAFDHAHWMTEFGVICKIETTGVAKLERDYIALKMDR